VSDLLLSLSLDLALSLVLGVNGLEGVAGNEERAGAKSTVLGSAHLTDLLSVKVSTDTTGAVTEGVGSKDNDVLSVGGDLELRADDLDGTVVHELDLGNELSGVLGTDDTGKALGTLVIDLNLELGLSLESGALLLLGMLGELNLGLSSEEKGDFLALGSDVLDENGDGLTAGAVLGQNVVAVRGDLGVEAVGDVVEGVDLVSLNGARGLGVDTENAITDVVSQALGGSEGKEGTDESVGTDGTEGETGVGLGDGNINEVLAWSHMGLDADLSLSSSLMERSWLM
jgi:hypothetical protein